MLTVTPIPALQDNYIWALSHADSRACAIVDPGEAAPVLDWLDQTGKQLVAILITHHHWDHTDGIADILLQYSVPVYGPLAETIPHCTHPLSGGDTCYLDALACGFDVLAIPGHTLGHIAYVGDNKLFCGDTLFMAGCGRLFEGTAAQMHASLTALCRLPNTTEVYCAHEYTEANLKFALHVEPDNLATLERLRTTLKTRAAGLATIPASLGVEKQTNPFLRLDSPTIQTHLRALTPSLAQDRLTLFSALRQLKDNFRS